MRYPLIPEQYPLPLQVLLQLQVLPQQIPLSHLQLPGQQSLPAPPQHLPIPRRYPLYPGLLPVPHPLPIRSLLSQTLLRRIPPRRSPLLPSLQGALLFPPRRSPLLPSLQGVLLFPPLPTPDRPPAPLPQQVRIKSLPSWLQKETGKEI